MIPSSRLQSSNAGRQLDRYGDFEGTQLIIGLLGLRGANLRRSLADLALKNACDDGDAKRYGGKDHYVPQGFASHAAFRVRVFSLRDSNRRTPIRAGGTQQGKLQLGPVAGSHFNPGCWVPAERLGKILARHFDGH